MRRRVPRALLGQVLAVPLAGCALFTTMWGRPEGFVARADRPPSVTGLSDFRGVVHCHSFRSHDSTGTIEEIGASCEEVGLDFLIMTDHLAPHTISRGRRGMVGSTLFLVGAEFRVPGGSLLAFPLKHYVRPHETLQEYLDDVHGQGGLAFVGHAERFTAWDHPGFDGVEVHNLHAAAVARNRVGLAARLLFTPLPVMFRALAVPDRDVFAAWDRRNEQQVLHEQRVLPGVAGNDAHANIRLLGLLGWVVGNYTEVFRVVTTHVLAERRGEAALVDAIRAGRTYVSIDLWRDGSGFAFWARQGSSNQEMGATVARGSELRVLAPIPAEIRLLRGGALVASARGRKFVHVAGLPGVYRVEVWLDGDPWIFSSPIRVR